MGDGTNLLLLKYGELTALKVLPYLLRRETITKYNRLDFEFETIREEIEKTRML